MVVLLVVLVHLALHTLIMSFMLEMIVSLQINNKPDATAIFIDGLATINKNGSSIRFIVLTCGVSFKDRCKL